jgi:hypothetical protein
VTDGQTPTPPVNSGWRFNPPPNWPAPPHPGWQPPAGWMPDSRWPPPPPGWQLWTAGASRADGRGGPDIVGELPAPNTGTPVRFTQKFIQNNSKRSLALFGCVVLLATIGLGSEIVGAVSARDSIPPDPMKVAQQLQREDVGLPYLQDLRDDMGGSFPGIPGAEQGHVALSTTADATAEAPFIDVWLYRSAADARNAALRLPYVLGVPAVACDRIVIHGNPLDAEGGRVRQALRRLWPSQCPSAGRSVPN